MSEHISDIYIYTSDNKLREIPISTTMVFLGRDRFTQLAEQRKLFARVCSNRISLLGKGELRVFGVSFPWLATGLPSQARRLKRTRAIVSGRVDIF